MPDRPMAPGRPRPRDRGRDPEARPREPARPRSRKPAPAVAAARAGLREIAELTGKQPEGVIGVEPAEDGWLVSVEVVEERRVPSSTDILAVYQAELDRDGTLVAYWRTRRYSRGHGDSSEAESGQ